MNQNERRRLVYEKTNDVINRESAEFKKKHEEKRAKLEESMAGILNRQRHEKDELKKRHDKEFNEMNKAHREEKDELVGDPEVFRAGNNGRVDIIVPWSCARYYDHRDTVTILYNLSRKGNKKLKILSEKGLSIIAGATKGDEITEFIKL